MGYIFGGNTGETIQSLAEKRKLIEALMKNNAPTPNSTGTGMAYLAQAIANKMKRQKLQDEISQGQTSAQGSWDTLLEGLFSGGQQASNPQDAWNAGVSAPPQGMQAPQTANVQAIVESLMGGQAAPNVNDPYRLMDQFNIQGMENPNMWINQDKPMGVPTPPRAGVTNLGDVTGVQNMGDMSSNAPAAPSPMAAGITEAAQALGISPTDLATVISYETGGTFNPMQIGPTTRFGQHKGLIQFGEPQAREYGVDWNNPLASQLGANGAIVQYMRAHGVKPGMGLMDIYSAVNAGAPGREGWSDAASGGAPGTVADKVNNQMAGHITKANALMGGSTAGGGLGPMPADQPDQRLAGNFDMETLQGLAAAAGNSYLPEGQRAIAQMLLQQATQEMFGSTDPMDALKLEEMRLKNENLRNPERKTIKLADDFLYWEDSVLAGNPQRVAPDVQMKQTGPLVEIGAGEKEVDKLFAEPYLAWIQGGGADTVGNTAQIGKVLEALEAGEPLTGSMAQIMNAPDFILALTDPTALDARERVEEVVQRNLRAILGPQFTEKEGERLIARAFNPKLGPKVNASRLRKLFKQMEIAALEMNRMVEHYQQNNFSLDGFVGRRPTLQDFYDAIGDPFGGGATDDLTPEMKFYLGIE